MKFLFAGAMRKRFIMLFFVVVISFMGAVCAAAATKIPVELDIDAAGAGAEELGHQVEKYFRSSDFYVLDKKRTPRVGVSVNAASTGDHKVVYYAVVLTVTTGKCANTFVGTIFGDTSGEQFKDLEKNIEKTIMKVARDMGL